MKSLFKSIEIQRVSNAVAAGQTTITSSAVDMSGFDVCKFEVHFGAITAGAATSVKIQQSSDDGASDAYSDLAGTSATVADDQDNKILVVEVVRPLKRYLKCIVSRATQNSVVDSIVAHKGEPRTLPVVQGSTVMAASETAASPDEGTA